MNGETIGRSIKFVSSALGIVFLSACVTTTTGELSSESGSAEEAARVNFRLGTEYFKKADYPTAYEKLKKSVSQDGTKAQPHAYLALVSEELDLSKDAAKHYREAIRLDPKDPAVQNMYGAYLCREGEPARAEKHFLEAANNRFYSTPEVAYVNAGSCLLKINRVQEAEEYFRSALQRNPSYALALWHMANLNFEQERDLQARAFLQRLGPPDVLPPEALLLGYRIENRSGNGKLAEEYRRSLQVRYPESEQTTQLLEMLRNGG